MGFGYLVEGGADSLYEMSHSGVLCGGFET